MIFLLLSCRSQKPITEVTESARVIKESIGPEAIFATGHSFETMKVRKMNVDFAVNGIRDNFNGNLAVSRDSLIAISIIPLLGYEAVRILCTKDSIIVINRTDKTYHASSFDYYLKKYNIPAGFDELQAVLANEVFFYKTGYKDIYFEKKFTMEGGRMLLIIESLMGNVKLANQEIAADSSCHNIRTVFVVDYRRGLHMEVRYDDFNGCEIESFPNRISVNIQDKISAVNLDIEYGQVIFDEPINVNFEIPEGYSRIYM
jgi:hypothetical protein